MSDDDAVIIRPPNWFKPFWERNRISFVTKVPIGEAIGLRIFQWAGPNDRLIRLFHFLIVGLKQSAGVRRHKNVLKSPMGGPEHVRIGPVSPLLRAQEV